MNGFLQNGLVLPQSEKGKVYTVKAYLGAGGQGEVYEVVCENNSYALKWYFVNNATKQQYDILEQLIDDGSPNDSFLWPTDLVKDSKSGVFGYIMDLRPKNYKGIVDLMKRRAEPSFANLVRSCFNLAKGYKQLHEAGYRYCDISFGNVFFDPENGNILICDNDNVAPKSIEVSIRGTEGFMAPEIYRNENTTPSRQTDQYSLAVLFFYMLMLHHPLEGKREWDIACKDVAAMKELYGDNPLFVFDPDDNSNYPMPATSDDYRQQNAITYWSIYPQYLKDLFIKSFTVGLKDPNNRVIDNDWLDAFAKMLGNLVICPSCGCELFVDNSMPTLQCWNTSCNRTAKKPSTIVIKKTTISLTKNTKIYSHYISDPKDYDVNTCVGEVVQNPNDPHQFGLRNLSNETWTYIKTDGTQPTVPPGKSATIALNAKINFGKVIGEFK